MRHVIQTLMILPPNNGIMTVDVYYNLKCEVEYNDLIHSLRHATVHHLCQYSNVKFCTFMNI